MGNLGGNLFKQYDPVYAISPNMEGFGTIVGFDSDEKVFVVALDTIPDLPMRFGPDELTKIEYNEPDFEVFEWQNGS